MDRLRPLNSPSVSDDPTWTDREIRDIKEDRFGYVQYVDVLRERILNTETPATIGIFGNWGSGKSSLMRMIDESIQADATVKNHVSTIWINVWELGTQEEVWHAFLQAIFSEVYSKIRWWRKIDWRKLGDQLLRNIWRIIVAALPAVAAVYLSKSGAGTWIDVLNVVALRTRNGWGLAGGLTTQIIALVTLYKPAWDAIRKSLKFDVSSVLKAGTYEAKISELMKLRSRYRSVVKLAVGERGRIVIFIDDLDRCTPDKVPDVLEAIKLFAATERCVYVLAFDQKVVGGRIAKKYAFELEEGTNYLEKIVQIPFQLPPLDQKDIEQFVREQYTELRGNEPLVFATGLYANPRTVKRALNSYRIIRGMEEKRVAAWEIDPLDAELVAKIVVIQAAFKSLYADLVDNPDHILEVETWAGDEKAKEIFDPKKFDRRAKASLRMMMRMPPHFGSDFEKRRIRWYISLGGETTGAEDAQRPDRKYRDALLSNDRDQIKAVLEQIVPDGLYTPEYENRIRNSYCDRLRIILGDDRRYTREQRLSANLALDLLENFKTHEALPETVRVPGRDFTIGGRTTDTVRRAKAQGINLELTKESEVIYWASPPNYRIGRYPVTYQEFGEFVKAFLRDSAALRRQPGIVECEAYRRPCVPDKRGISTYSSSPTSYQFEFSGGGRSLPSEPCTFKREDGTPVATISVWPVETTVDDAVIALALKVELDPDQDPKSYVFEILRSGDWLVRSSEEIVPASLKSAVTRAFLYANKALVRIRLMDSENEPNKELSHLPVPEQPFAVDVTVWDWTAIRGLVPSIDRQWKIPDGEEKHPVTDVTWDDAVLYCRWLAGETGLPCRLPTEIEWELAATGGAYPAPLFPWGDNLDRIVRANTRELGLGSTTPVDSYAESDSPYCCRDMAGNVWEWCADTFSEGFEIERTGDAWQDVKLHGKIKTELKTQRSVRGGSYYEDISKALCAHREGREANQSSPMVGFRIAIASGWEGVRDVRKLESAERK
jgi:formylglycine-generating enzyme required for sulfatase activity